MVGWRDNERSGKVERERERKKTDVIQRGRESCVRERDRDRDRDR